MAQLTGRAIGVLPRGTRVHTRHRGLLEGGPAEKRIDGNVRFRYVTGSVSETNLDAIALVVAPGRAGLRTRRRGFVPTCSTVKAIPIVAGCESVTALA